MRNPLHYFSLQRGMTVLELIVVIAAVIVVVAAGPRVYEVFRVKAHDIRRQSHVEQIRSALQIYYLHNNSYPIASRGERITGEDTMSTTLRRSFLLLDTRLPVDPRSPEYDYYYQSSADGRSYTITYCLEALADESHTPDCNNKAYPLPIGSQS